MGSDASSPSRHTKRSTPPAERHPDAGQVRRGDADPDEEDPVDPTPEQVHVGRPVPTLAEIRDHWPATVDVATAGTVFGLSRSHSYELVKRGEFPAKVIQIGSRYRVLTESILRAVSDEPPPAFPTS